MHHPFSHPHIHTNCPVLGGCRGELRKDAVDGKVSLSCLVESCRCSLMNLWLRWQMILLSPEEEDDIVTQLAGSGWYRAIGKITSKHSAPKIVPPSNWRYAWVRDTPRSLEAVIPKLGDERSLAPIWLEWGDNDVPLPPPAEYPLHTRPRVAEYVCQLMHSNWSVPSHIIPGPPYSLIVVEDPDARNAFSYGFGPDGAGGIVVFSSFIDDFLLKNKSATTAPPAGSPNSGSGSGSGGTSLWSRLVPLVACLCVSFAWHRAHLALLSSLQPHPTISLFRSSTTR